MENLKEINEKFAHSHTLWGLMHSDHSAPALIPVVVSQGQVALCAGIMRAEINRTESIQQMIVVFFQSAIILEVANSMERLIKLRGICFKIWGYVEPYISAFFFFENETVALALHNSFS